MLDAPAPLPSNESEADDEQGSSVDDTEEEVEEVCC